jgi:glycosyltransferase involved in cell wall biosynthesis
MHGGGVRMYHNIRILGRRHEVHVISFVENDEERRRVGEIAPICSSIQTVARTPDLRARPLSLSPSRARMFDVPAMHAAVDQTRRRANIDVLQCDYVEMAGYRRPGVFTIWSVIEVLAPDLWRAFRAEPRVAGRLRALYDWISMLNYETSASRRFDRVVTMTESDAAYLRKRAPGADIRVVPVGVDTAHYAPTALAPGGQVRVVFLGNFRHDPNVEAVRFLARDVAPAFPDLRFEIAGGGLPAGLLDGTRLEALGYQDDTRRLYRRPDTIVAAPLRSGTGQRVKLLEAFSMGVPVVTTPLGASGFPVRDGLDAFIAETPEQFRKALAALRDSAQLREDMGTRGRRMVVKRFEWERLAGSFLEVVEPPDLRRIS